MFSVDKSWMSRCDRDHKFTNHCARVLSAYDEALAQEQAFASNTYVHQRALCQAEIDCGLADALACLVRVSSPAHMRTYAPQCNRVASILVRTCSEYYALINPDMRRLCREQGMFALIDSVQFCIINHTDDEVLHALADPKGLAMITSLSVNDIAVLVHFIRLTRNQNLLYKLSKQAIMMQSSVQAGLCTLEWRHVARLKEYWSDVIVSRHTIITKAGRTAREEMEDLSKSRSRFRKLCECLPCFCFLRRRYSHLQQGHVEEDHDITIPISPTQSTI